MSAQANSTSQNSTGTQSKKTLSKRVPRFGKLIFSELEAPVSCAIRSFNTNEATIVLSGWLGLPSSFTLYIEPDNLRASCAVKSRRGSHILVELNNLEEGVRLRRSSEQVSKHTH